MIRLVVVEIEGPSEMELDRAEGAIHDSLRWKPEITARVMRIDTVATSDDCAAASV